MRLKPLAVMGVMCSLSAFVLLLLACGAAWGFWSGRAGAGLAFGMLVMVIGVAVRRVDWELEELRGRIRTLEQRVEHKG